MHPTAVVTNTAARATNGTPILRDVYNMLPPAPNIYLMTPQLWSPLQLLSVYWMEAHAILRDLHQYWPNDPTHAWLDMQWRLFLPQSESLGTRLLLVYIFYGITHHRNLAAHLHNLLFVNHLHSLQIIWHLHDTLVVCSFDHLFPMHIVQLLWDFTDK